MNHFPELSVANIRNSDMRNKTLLACADEIIRNDINISHDDPFFSHAIRNVLCLLTMSTVSSAIPDVPAITEERIAEAQELNEFPEELQSFAAEYLMLGAKTRKTVFIAALIAYKPYAQEIAQRVAE